MDFQRRVIQRISGPTSILPFHLESLLSWALALGCLSISGYHYLLKTIIKPKIQRLWFSPSEGLIFWLPLVTHTNTEMVVSPQECFEKILPMLEMKGSLLTSKIRKDLNLRRLVSLAMRTKAKSEIDVRKGHPLFHELIRIWPELVRLPRPSSNDVFEISLVVPCFRERGDCVAEKLDYSWRAAVEPQNIQVILVDAGGCENLNIVQESHSQKWGKLETVIFEDGTGRGPTMNFGARLARGKVLSFLHSDTRLPKEWDRRILQTMDSSSTSTVNSCAFQFGIDTSPEGLDGGIFPPGIHAVETTANLRCKFWSLPYGDQCLSLPTHVFHHLGGFPNQCIMEDYELVSLLRQRVAVGSHYGISEALEIIPGAPALCSPRRWQKYGVFFVTWTNSSLVNLYARGVVPERIYELYYGQSLSGTKAVQNTPS